MNLLKTFLVSAVFSFQTLTAIAAPAAGPSSAVKDTFKKYCTSCHANYLGSNGKVDWTKVAANANSIQQRLDWTEGVSNSQKMPPISSPQFKELSKPAQATKLLALRKAIRAESYERDLPLDKINLPPGFSIAVFAKVPNARSMTLGKGNTVYVGTRRGHVYAVQDADMDGYGEKVFTLASDLNVANGVAYRNGELFVAEQSRVVKFSGVDRLTGSHPKTTINDSFPSDSLHGWKYLAFGPDDMLYVPLGAPCNICDKAGYASIYRMKPDGSGKEVFVKGVRNTVGFTWHPTTKEMWFTDNGRDRMGDNKPSDELNRVSRKGLHYGYPYCHQGNILDPEFGRGKNCADYQKPAKNLQPHTAALGLKFYQGSMFPAKYKGQIFIAEHGSWNRTTPVGCRIMQVKLNGNKAETYEVFADGWLTSSGTKLGRPVDVLVLKDGSLLVSDDMNGVIYRISYRQ